MNSIVALGIYVFTIYMTLGFFEIVYMNENIVLTYTILFFVLSCIKLLAIVLFPLLSFNGKLDVHLFFLKMGKFIFVSWFFSLIAFYLLLIYKQDLVAFFYLFCIAGEEIFIKEKFRKELYRREL